QEAGDDLAKLISGCRAKGMQLPFDFTFMCLKQICSALQALHATGIAHHDVKPANIMVSPDGSIKLIALGGARLQGPADGETTLAGMVVPFDYRAPERLAPAYPVDHRADIYAL